ncbi:trehalose 6-phosphate phosphatase [Angustibacter aerolatus]|uniref:Trehalose 6-phosphate phosphatase n=1 Tax=Angustibacter aerolatus TaxID=1162965 RepID=A0ABQ6JLF6_9ACTN|nr:trehalose-phosphatase [Angustibacter aerolatus]GMA87625.1 trehalose 6-phosphate phosphatase [Angustibacter aerolatus]
MRSPSLARHRPLLVALDFDGVLSPIVDVPEDARPLAGTTQILRDLADRDDVVLALVSGRARASLAAVSGLGEHALLVGSHGAEIDGEHPGLDDGERALLQQVVDGLEQVATEHPGARVEHKPSAGVLHTRVVEAGHARAATSEALQAMSGLPGVHVMQGKDVVEVSVTEASKGAAVRTLREAHHAAAVLYAGDDRTDETVFTTLGPDDLGIKVGPGDTAARVRVADPAAVRLLLRTLRDLLADDA